MNVSLLSGENRSGAVLRGLLESRRYRDFRFAVAYARRAGVVILEPSMRGFIKRGGGAYGIVGVNQGNTSYQGLCLLADIIGDGLHLRCGRKGGGVFHPKLYLFGKKAGIRIKNRKIAGK